MRQALGLGTLAVIAVLALACADVGATSDGASAGCSNQTVAVVGKATVLRFVLHRVSCQQAHSLIRRYYDKVTVQSCRSRGSVCAFNFPGGWTCSAIFSGEGPGFAGCVQPRSHRFVRVFKVAPATRAPRQRFFATAGTLQGVTAIGAGDAWAVGASGNRKTLILHWDGRAWSQVASPSPGANAYLTAVAATSASDAWAVGSTATGRLILHWDGGAWTEATPTGGANDELTAVAATSASDAWAVGGAGTGTLILHWDGHAWTRVPSPAGGRLSGVAASSALDAWAVGTTTRARTLTVHWDGTAWRRVLSPSPTSRAGLADELADVAVTPFGNAWTVGSSGCGCGPGKSLIERWNGHAWKRTPSSTVGFGTELNGVVGVSAHSAWAVGASGVEDSPTTAVTLRWSRNAWRQVRSPSPGGSAFLSSVAATSPDDVWAVGGAGNRSRSRFRTLILHWNGTAWER